MRPELVFTVQPGGDFQTSNARLPGRVATGGPGTTPTCHRDRLPRYGGVPRAGKTARDFLRRPCRTIKNLPNLPEARLDLPQSKYARATDATLSGRPPVQAAGFEASWAFHARLVKVGNPPDPAVYYHDDEGRVSSAVAVGEGEEFRPQEDRGHASRGTAITSDLTQFTAQPAPRC